MATVSAILPVRRSVELALTPPYDFKVALGYVATSPSAVLERISNEDGIYRRAAHLMGQDVLLALRSLGTIEQPRLLLEIHSAASADDALQSAAINLVRHVFTLDDSDDEMREFAELGMRDPIFGTLIQRLHGVRPILIPDPFEALIWAVIGQQINVTFARKLKLALVDLCGHALHTATGTYALAPEPEAVAALEFDQLRARQFSRQKATYVLELARVVAGGELELPALASLSLEEAVVALTRFKGVGRWTAEYVLMRGLGVRDSLPAGDVGLRAIIGRWYGLGRHASESEVRLIAEKWAGWRGWAAFYWWFCLQNKWMSPEECKTAVSPKSS
ncbi:MAG: DNA-3-methyladenine glycosylase family protein [Ktedonobacterales bacterium]